MEFPRDHGSHPTYRSEWWYLTGHLQSTDSSQQYGFQLTFFRAATQPDAPHDQIYMAHAALTNLNTGEFLHEERINQSGWNAQASVGELDVFNGNWSLRMTDSATETMEARFSVQSQAVLKLTLRPSKPRTLFGDNGYSRKGATETAASHYITFTRLDVSGSIETASETESLTGLAWMDHEFSSSQLDENQIGWNWTSAILNDGSELMAYVMRRNDGQTDPNSTLTLIAKDGSKRKFSSRDFSWSPLRYWNSPHSGARYPIDYELSWNADGQTRRIVVKAQADDQELHGRIGQFQYWEGAGRVVDPEGNPIGSAYTELTGYAKSLQGRF